MRRFIFCLIAAAGCSDIQYNKCDSEQIAQIERGIDSALSVFDGAEYALDKLTVSCSEKPPFADVPCVTWQYGTSSIPGYRTRIAVQNKLAGECMIHELHHVALYATYGDGCSKHLTDCEWDYAKIDLANDIYYSNLK